MTCKVCLLADTRTERRNRGIYKYVEVTNPDISYPGTARHVSDGDSPTQRINQCFLNTVTIIIRHLHPLQAASSISFAEATQRSRSSSMALP